MLQSKQTNPLRFLTLVLICFLLSVTWPGAGSAAPWDKLIKKAKEAITEIESITEAVDDDEDEPPTQNVPEVAEQLEKDEPPAKEAPKQGAKPASKPVAAGPATGRNLIGVPYLLLQMKYQSSPVPDDQLLKLTERQVRSDQNVYSDIARLEVLKKELQEFIQKEATAKGMYKQSYKAMITSKQQQVASFKKRLEAPKLGLVFDRNEVENRDVSFVARELLPKFRQHLENLAAGLPDHYTIEFKNRMDTHIYHFEKGMLYWGGSQWACEPEIDETCFLVEGTSSPYLMGSHFFLQSGNLLRTGQARTGQARLWSQYEGYFLLRPPKPPGYDYLNPNPHGYPGTLVTGVGGSNSSVAVIVVDRNMEVPGLKMDAASAEAMLHPPPLTQQEINANASETLVPFSYRTMRSVLHVNVQEVPVPDKSGKFIKVSLEKIEIFSPEGKLLVSHDAGDFTSSVDQQAAAHSAQAEADAALATAASAAQAAQTQVAADEAARLEGFDVIGFRLGMSLADADQMVRQHMTPTSEYRFERSEDFMAFDRSVIYFHFDDLLKDTPVPDSCKDKDLSDPINAGFVKYCEELRENTYWQNVIPKEAIALTIEQSKAGKDVVLGITRWLSLPSNVNTDVIKDSLRRKYGNPDSESEHQEAYTLIWGECKTESRQPYTGTNGKQKLYTSGDVINDHANLWSFIPNRVVHTGLQFGVDSPGVVNLEGCRPAVSATLKPIGHNVEGMMLNVSLTDYGRYLEVFRELVASDAGPVKEKVDIDL